MRTCPRTGTATVGELDGVGLLDGMAGFALVVGLAVFVAGAVLVGAVLAGAGTSVADAVLGAVDELPGVDTGAAARSPAVGPEQATSETASPTLSARAAAVVPRELITIEP
ncbi:MAG: hypothetical protein WAL50_16075 [Kineosporiaceae bacterium]|jgi:hypothetical protein